jgi:zinc transporter 9
LHKHDDHYHVHEHYHGGSENVAITLIGLVIHSIADGVALGASFYRKVFDANFSVSKISESSNQLGFIIFMAVLMHKAPAAIGFGTFLKHEG